jgi:hypothetical protein
MTMPISDNATKLRKKFRDDSYGDGSQGEYWVPVGLAARLADIVTAEEILYWDSDAENDNGTVRGSFPILTRTLLISASLVQDASERFKDDLKSATVVIRRLADVVAVVLDGQDWAWSGTVRLVGGSAVILRFPGEVDVPITLGGRSALDFRPILPGVLSAANVK